MPPVYSFALKVDTADVASMSLKVASLPRNWSTPKFSFHEVALPGLPGVVATSNEPQLEPDDYTIIGNIITASPSALETAVDVLKYAFAVQAGVTLTPGNQPNRQRTGVLQEMEIQPYPSLAEARFNAVLHCRDPLWYATTNTTVPGSASTDLAVAQGTYKAWPVITLTGATNPVLTYKNAAGATIATLTLTASGTLIVDMRNRTVTDDGVRADNVLTAGDFFALDPRDGVLGTTSPTVRTSSGSISIVYRKAYL